MNEIAEAARSPEFQDERHASDHMVVGEPHEVVERLIDIKARAEADELVLVGPGLDRSRRITSYTAIAMDGPRLNRTTSECYEQVGRCGGRRTVPTRSTESFRSIGGNLNWLIRRRSLTVRSNRFGGFNMLLDRSVLRGLGRVRFAET
jgi:hypothetical protein